MSSDTLHSGDLVLYREKIYKVKLNGTSVYLFEPYSNIKTDKYSYPMKSLLLYLNSQNCTASRKNITKVSNYSDKYPRQDLSKRCNSTLPNEGCDPNGTNVNELKPSPKTDLDHMSKEELLEYLTKNCSKEELLTIVHAVECARTTSRSIDTLFTKNCGSEGWEFDNHVKTWLQGAKSFVVPNVSLTLAIRSTPGPTISINSWSSLSCHELKTKTGEENVAYILESGFPGVDFMIKCNGSLILCQISIQSYREHRGDHPYHKLYRYCKMLKPYCVYEMLRKFFNLSFDSNKSVEAHGDWFVYWTSCKAATRDEGSTAPDFHDSNVIVLNPSSWHKIGYQNPKYDLKGAH